MDLVTGTCLQLFGSHRCTWGSNFPVEQIWTELPPLVAAWRRAFADQPADARDEVFVGTARQVYSL